ncbi:hypothetical protein NPIL_25181 [Nephila pilipes]|uniref:Uncharacterized protein n=1 Tax=Nephila pilipes TaxID=299642 RepID=A0A8X6QD57_NEPPI|nr:hypothetical protein NPIL_107701 [Nephila pilipes]GFU20432.1 hypothetical protein NPIL_25181 [Nephila pilipes]
MLYVNAQPRPFAFTTRQSFCVNIGKFTRRGKRQKVCFKSHKTNAYNEYKAKAVPVKVDSKDVASRLALRDPAGFVRASALPWPIVLSLSTALPQRANLPSHPSCLGGWIQSHWGRETEPSSEGSNRSRAELDYLAPTCHVSGAAFYH